MNVTPTIIALSLLVAGCGGGGTYPPEASDLRKRVAADCGHDVDIQAALSLVSQGGYDIPKLTKDVCRVVRLGRRPFIVNGVTL